MIDKNKFKEQNFTSTGIINAQSDNGIGRVPRDWRPCNNPSDLQELIRNIMWEKTDEYNNENNKDFTSYVVMEECCRIPTDTMKKALNGRYKITRNFLAKFTVGLKLEIKESNCLFKIHSGELNPTNDFDYIVIHGLESKDNIDDFIEEVDELIKINLDKIR